VLLGASFDVIRIGTGALPFVDAAGLVIPESRQVNFMPFDDQPGRRPPGSGRAWMGAARRRIHSAGVGPRA
jgi:hypothetical protein